MKKRRVTIHHLLPGFSLVFTLFVFAPVDLYLSSAEEFWFSLGDLVRWLAIFGFAAFVIVSLLAVLLPAKLSVAFRAAAGAGSILAWLQGNLLVPDYGRLNGQAVDWSAYTLQYVLHSLLWIAVITLFIVLMFRFRKRFRRIMETALCVLLVTQVISLSVFLVQGQREKTGDRYLSTRGEYSVSSGRNVVVFVLDTFDSHLFENLRQKYPDLIASEFEDFTFYPDTVGGATRTKYAIPFILTGTTNREEQSYTEYLAASYPASPLIRELSAGGYETGFYTVSHYLDMSCEEAIDNIISGKPDPSSHFGLTKQFMKLVAFRYLPSVFSRFFWMYTGDFEHWKGRSSVSAYSLDDVRFYRYLTSEKLSVTTGSPVFRFYHLAGAHEPYTMNEDCERVPVGDSDEEFQSIGALKIVHDYITQLKALGVYDRTTVIVLADHGYGTYSSVEQSPLFMVRLAGSSHPFEVSDLPLSYASMPEIMASAARGTLTTMEPYRASSPRYFYLQSEQKTVINITEFAISGPVWDSPAEETGTVYHENSLRISRDYVPGTTLYFDERDTARNHILSGFSRNEGIYTWTSGSDAKMLFTLPETPGALQLVLEHSTYDGRQTVEVWVNDKLVETYTASGSTRRIVTIPAGTVTGTELSLRLHLPDAHSPASLGQSSDSRELALSMISLTLRAAGQ